MVFAICWSLVVLVEKNEFFLYGEWRESLRSGFLTLSKFIIFLSDRCKRKSYDIYRIDANFRLTFVFPYDKICKCNDVVLEFIMKTYGCNSCCKYRNNTNTLLSLDILSI